MAAKNREKDQAMAARMKQQKVARAAARCPICTKVVPLGQFQTHVAHHP